MSPLRSTSLTVAEDHLAVLPDLGDGAESEQTVSASNIDHLIARRNVGCS